MKTITLKTPVTKGERTINELTFAEPKVRHMLALDSHPDKDSYGADLALTAALTGESEKLLGEMTPEDWHEVRKTLGEVYFRFMGLDPALAREALEDPPATGKKKASLKSSKG